MCGVKCITFALWINILNVMTADNKFKLEITPKHRVIHVGEDLELTCRVNNCPVNVTFVWKAAMDKFTGGDSKNNQTVSRLLIKNYSVKHSDAILCKATCQGKQQEKASMISVFSFPQDPVLPKIKSLIANQEQQLICTVLDIYPLDKLQIKWLRGDKTLHMDEPDESISDHVQNYSSVFNYTPSVDDLGKNISCKATLKLNGQIRTTTAEYGPGTITISSNNTSVMLGKHLEITCHADGNPKPTILWWKLGESEPELHSKNHTLIINNASWSQAGWYRCDAKNDVGSQQIRIKVTVLGPPNVPKIQLSHTEEPKEGDNISIFCSSEGGPAQLKLYRQSQSTVTGGANKSTVLLNISSIQITDAGIYICEAKNDFGTERSTINITVKAKHRISTTPDLSVAIGLAVGSVLLLTAAGLLIQHCRKKDRSDSSNITLS
ncbi:vascular cell adhesion protein 1 isoform X2 [Labeo rohita]|uniref:vascular cell adhesion protein 1 isoform X2 n=1 Tax=Labeo rohita TaxID=84645 RepID=UPI0021E2BABF|nr:vascular cell adhesion protein 1 isoform X2 [Labeo rohita]